MFDVIMRYVWEYRFVLIVLLVGVIFTQKNQFKAIVFQTMLQAKSLAKDAVLTSGQEQEDWVVERLWVILPAYIKLFFTKDMLRKTVKKLYYEAKDYLDDGKFNDSI